MNWVSNIFYKMFHKKYVEPSTDMDDVWYAMMIKDIDYDAYKDAYKDAVCNGEMWYSASVSPLGKYLFVYLPNGVSVSKDFGETWEDIKKDLTNEGDL